MQDIIPFIIVGGFLAAVVYSTVKSRKDFTDEQTAMNNLYEYDSVLGIDDIEHLVNDLIREYNLRDNADMVRCVDLLARCKESTTSEARQLNQRIASCIRTLKQALLASDAEQIDYSMQYLEVLLTERSHMGDSKN